MRHDRIPLINGNEYDALTRWRHFIRWRAKQRRAIRRFYNRRVRRRAKSQLRSSDIS